MMLEIAIPDAMMKNGVVKPPLSSMREPNQIATAETAPPTAISSPLFVARSFGVEHSYVEGVVEW